jgi:hypothetical protein
MILRNTQCIRPVSDVHVYLEGHQQELGGKTFGEFLSQEEKFLTSLTTSGGSGLFHLGRRNFCEISRNSQCFIGNSMNHSCDPNVIIATCFNDHKIKVIALREIMKGEELCFSYIDETQSLEIRKKELQEKYLFQCKCRKCILEEKT